jgi:hypothetical protein
VLTVGWDVWQEDGIAMDLPAVPRKARTGWLTGDEWCEVASVSGDVGWGR